MRSATELAHDPSPVSGSPDLLRRWGPLFLISALGLFLELAVIRWLSAEVRIFSYFKNFPLLAAFLGLGIGFGLVGRRRSWMSAFAPTLLVFAVLVIAVGRTDPLFLAYPGGAGEEFVFYTISPQRWLAAGRFLGAVLVFFLVTMFLFIPLGQATGEEMARHAPLPAYITNIIASLAGVWVFALLSFLETPPAAWFGLGLGGLAAYLARRGALGVWRAVSFAVFVGAVAVTGHGVVWSPYQRLAVTDVLWPTEGGQKVQIGHALDISRVFFQQAIDLSLTQVNDRIIRDIAVTYEVPYRLRPRAERVLIVGVGMGNDAAAALRQNAQRVDAVEIDPAIMAFGAALHPERPYGDSRVVTIVDDARSFFKGTRERYDVIAFGLLDSHTLFSGLSSVRLDSFVYTLESLREARAHLREGGLLGLAFAQSPPWIKERLGRMLEAVFGAGRVYIRSGFMGTNFVVGDAPAADLATLGLTVWRPDPRLDGIPLATDDWPYLYMRARTVPAAYWQMLLLIGIACFVLIGWLFPAMLRPDWHFWLLGAAFLLVEFKSITEMALLFGTTWLVNALAISGVLLMVLGANLVSLRWPALELRAIYACLFGTLALAYAFPLAALNVLPPGLRAVASMVLLSLPIFFAGLIFAQSLRRAGETARPLASNLSGTVAGGVLEYGSMWWGVKSLYLIAAAVYAGALLAARRGRG
jgi:spermidine synthase